MGRSRANQAHYIMNMEKWEAARSWCKQKGIFFRVITEEDIFHPTLNSFNNEIETMTKKLEDLLNMPDSKEIINDDKKKEKIKDSSS